MSRRSVVSLISLAVSGLTLTAAGAQVVPLGGVFDAAALQGRHESPVAAAGPDGAFRLVWHQPSFGLHEAIWTDEGHRRLPAHAARGDKANGGDPLMLANEKFPELWGSGELRDRSAPALTPASADGKFWAVWTEGLKWVSSGPLFYDARSLDEDVYAQRFTFEGRPIGSPFRVDRGGDARQRAAQLVPRDAGGILAVWEHGDASTLLEPGDSVRIRALDAHGNGIGGEIQLHDNGLMARGPAIARGVGADSALVTWEGKADVAGRTGIWARVVDAADGTPRTDAVRLDAGGERDQRRSTIAALPDGSYLVAWQGATNQLVTGYTRNYRTQTRARRVSAEGVAVGPVMLLSDAAEEQNSSPRAVTLADGRAFVVWITWGTSVFSPLHIMGTVVGESGPSALVEMTDEQLAPQNAPALAANGNTIFLAWSGYGEDQTPTVHARRFEVVSQ